MNSHPTAALRCTPLAEPEAQAGAEEPDHRQSKQQLPTVGIFSKTYQRKTLHDVFEAVTHDGYRSVHFNFTTAGLHALPQDPDELTCRKVATTAARYELEIVGVSATYNMINPDRQKLRTETARAQRVIEAAPLLGSRLVTLCTGTRDPYNIWRGHPENSGAHAWQELLDTLELLRTTAAASGVVLGIEPEPSNVISTAAAAYELLVTHGPGHLGIVLDLGNLLSVEHRQEQHQAIHKVVELLGPWIAMVHAKDLDEQNRPCPPGTGWIDWELLLGLLSAQRYTGPIVVHGIDEAQARDAQRFLTRAIENAFRGR